jgi:hypothetical protein
MADTPTSRVLRKIVPGCVWTTDAILPYIHVSQVDGKGGGNWEVYSNDNAVPFLVHRTYYDITGWSKQQMSAFVAGVGWQESDRWTVNDPMPTPTPSGFAPELNSWDIISKSEIPNTALDGSTWQLGLGYFGWNAPGMPRSNFNLEEIFAGRSRQWIPNANMNNVIHQTNETLWGAGDATAGDRIYLTRIVAPWLISNTAEGLETVGIIPPQAVIVPAVIEEEPDLQYIERLRRSYVDAGSRTL